MTSEEQQAAYGHLSLKERFAIYMTFEPTWRWLFCYATYHGRFPSYVERMKYLGYKVDSNHHIIISPNKDTDLCTFPTPDTMLSWCCGGFYTGVPFYDLTTGKTYTNTGGWEWIGVEKKEGPNNAHDLTKPARRLQVREIG